MATIVTLNDFKGRFAITIPSLPNKLAELEAEITRLEKRELVNLFGMELYNQFVIDPQAPDFLPLYEAMMERDEYSEGLIPTIVAFIYFKLSTDAYFLPTENGRIAKSPENGKILTPVTRDIKVFNEAILGYRVIQRYCAKHFRGVFKGVSRELRFY